MFRFGVLNIALHNSVWSLESTIAHTIDHYERLESNKPIDLRVEISPRTYVKRVHLGVHWDYKDGWAGRFGHFFVQRWHLSGQTPRVVCAIARSPLAPVRPLLDYEMHSASQDIGKFLHEAVLIPATLLLRGTDAVVFHGATLRAPDGNAVLITGRGGVGKTSFALELRGRSGWAFISDDLVPVDARGIAYLNAAWPKIYAYNVADDRELERLVLEGRSIINRSHWRLLKRWPDRVRRSVPPERLFGGLAQSSELGKVLLVERGEFPKVGWHLVSVDEVAQTSAVILEAEMARFGRHMSLHSSFRKSQGLRDLPTSWDPVLWQEIMGQALTKADTYKVAVPLGLSASEYRRQMISVIAEIANGS